MCVAMIQFGCSANTSEEGPQCGTGQLGAVCGAATDCACAFQCLNGVCSMATISTDVGGAPPVGSDTVNAGVCTPQQTKCDGPKLLTCKTDGKSWAEFTCPKGCANGQCVQSCQGQPPVCINNQTLQYCDPSGALAQKACTQGCTNGKCNEDTQQCQPNQTRCSSSAPNYVETCKADGTGWVLAQTACATKCVNGQCTGPSQVCKAGETFCQNNVLFSCNVQANQWLQTPCPNGCMTTNSVSQCKGDCPAGFKQCINTKQIKECDEAFNYKVTTCDYQCQNNQCAALCVANQLFCSNEGKHIMKCSADGKTANAVESCAFGCDIQSVKCKNAACQIGETKCSTAQPNYIEACKPDQSGFQLIGQPCQFKCVNGKCQNPVCTPGQLKCGTDGIMACAADQSGYALKEACPAGCVVNTQGQPQCAKCKAGQKTCDWFKIKECKNPLTGWETKTCNFPDTCAAGGCVSVLKLESSDKTQSMVSLLKEWSACFNNKVAGPCGGINTQEITYNITLQELEDYVCSNAGSKAALGDSIHKTADDIFGCGDNNLFDIQMAGGQITQDLDGKQCFGYCSGCNNILELDINNKELIVQSCEKF